MKGKIVIESDRIKTGMIRLGDFGVSLYSNTGIVWENHGGTVIFYGKCQIGNASAISVGEKGALYFGRDFTATAALKIACYHKISFGQNVLIGWENVFMDTDFHQTKKVSGEKKKAFGEIIVGDNNWFGLGCLTLKNTYLENNIIIAAKSILNKKYEYPVYSVIGGSPAKLIATGVYRDPNDDIINYNT